MTRHLRTALGLLVVAWPLAACASAPRAEPAGPTGAATVAQAGSESPRRRTCSPVDQALLAQGPVYALCDVDEPPRLIGQPARTDFQPPMGRTVCYEAILEAVVDERGHVVPDLVRVVKMNNTEFANATKRALLSQRYTPAKKGGVAVRSVVQGGGAVSTGSVVVSGRGAAPPPPPGRFRGC